MRHRALLSLFVAFLIGVGVTIAVEARRNAHDGGSTESSPKSASSSGRSAVDAIGTTGEHDDGGDVVTTGLFRTIAKRQNPLVVAITTQSHVKSTDTSQFSGGDDFFSRFFGGAPHPRDQVRHALGSGFLIGSDGEILTNNHVVAGADQIRVALFTDEHRTYVADVIGRDPLTDSALVKLKDAPKNLPSASLGDSDTLEPGDWVMAIGNPFELGHTVTVGVISYKGRPFATTEGRFQNMLQTDASINPGNSGGPLIDVHGQVVGINTAILSGAEGGGNVGIGFAVPINTVKDLLPQLRKGSVQRGQLGVQILTAPLTDDEARQLGLPKPQGAIVSRVEPGSPADRAGLRAGDVIVEYNGQVVQDAAHLTSMVVKTPAGAQVPIVFYRNGQQQSASATIQRLNMTGADAAVGGGGAPGFGVSIGDITPEVARELRLPTNVRGAVVENVEPFTPASNAGIKPGDVILDVNRQPVNSAADASRALRAIKSGDAAFLLLSRNGVQEFVEVRKE
jgi:serine protease Do